MAAVIQENELTSNGSPRYNLYSSIHKALRGFMIDTVARVGQADVDDDCEFDLVIEQVRALLQACRGHLQHEDEFVHPAMERVLTRSSQDTRNDHVEHAKTITALESQVSQLAATSATQRAMLTNLLYLNLTAFVAENFEHMLVEETDNHEVLISAYTDAELVQIKDAIVASIPPEENMLTMKWILEYSNNAERLVMLQGMKHHAPAFIFEAVMNLARTTLSQRDYFKLECALI